MILQALTHYYEDLLKRAKLAAPDGARSRCPMGLSWMKKAILSSCFICSRK